MNVVICKMALHLLIVHKQYVVTVNKCYGYCLFRVKWLNALERLCNATASSLKLCQNLLLAVNSKQKLDYAIYGASSEPSLPSFFNFVFLLRWYGQSFKQYFHNTWGLELSCCGWSVTSSDPSLRDICCQYFLCIAHCLGLLHVSKSRPREPLLGRTGLLEVLQQLQLEFGLSTTNMQRKEENCLIFSQIKKYYAQTWTQP